MNQVIDIRAYAKINLSLRVIGRYDDGYHRLDMLSCTIDFYDNVSIKLYDDSREKLYLGGPYAISLKDDAQETNLAIQAWRAFSKEFSWPVGIEIHIDKQIPPGSGLGGGSADAAAILASLYLRAKAEGRLSDLDKSSLYRIALSLGADVPFQLHGGLARIGGRGELIEKITDSSSAKRPCLVIVPPIFSSTPLVYKSYQELSGDGFSEAYRDPLLAIETHENDLFEAACHCSPEIRSVREKLSEISPYPVGFSGSGSSMFILGPHHGFDDDFMSAISRLCEMENLLLKSTSLLANFNGICQI